MKRLYLEDLAGLTQEEVYRHISYSYEVPIEEVQKHEILIAYESVGSWGCDSSSWFCLKTKKMVNCMKLMAVIALAMVLKGSSSQKKLR